MKALFVYPMSTVDQLDFGASDQVAAAEKITFEVADYINRNYSTRIDVARTWSSGENEKISNTHVHNISTPSPNSVSLGSNLERIRAIIKTKYLMKKVDSLIEVNSYDIVFTFQLLNGYFMEARDDVHHVHFNITHDMFFDQDASRTRNHMIREVSNGADDLIVLTDSIRTHLEDNGIEVSDVIPNGIDSSRYKDSGDKKYILYSGKIEPRKRVGQLVDAYLQSNLPDSGFNLRIQGEGPEKDNIIKRTSNIDSISVGGFQSYNQYIQTLANCSFFVLPSILEAFGVVLIESMASGKPVISRNIRGPTDIIDHKENGYLFEDTDDLSNYMEHLCHNPRLRTSMGENAQQKVEKKYTINKVAGEYNRAISDLQ